MAQSRPWNDRIFYATFYVQYSLFTIDALYRTSHSGTRSPHPFPALDFAVYVAAAPFAINCSYMCKITSIVDSYAWRPCTCNLICCNVMPFRNVHVGLEAFHAADME